MKTASTAPQFERLALALRVVAIVALAVAAPAAASNLDVNVDSSFTGTFGLEVGLDTMNQAYVQDDSPAAENSYRARFYVDPSLLGYCHSNCSAKVFTGYDGAANEIFAVIVRINHAGDYQLRVEYYDGGSTGNKVYSAPARGWAAIEIDWAAASSAAASDGYFDLWVNGIPKPGVSGIDTDNLAVEYVRLGNPDGHDFYSGAVRFDDFESRRDAYIGLITGQALAPPYDLAPDASPAQNPPRFEWTPVPGASYYRINVYDRTLTTNVHNVTVFSTSFKPAAALDTSHLWQWRVRSYSDGVAGPYSDWFPFSFPSSVPGTPYGLLPSGQMTQNPPTFTWNPATGADKYLVYVRDVDLGTDIYALQVPGTEFTPPSPLNTSHSYTFRVRAHNNAGWGPSSAVRYVDFATAPPPQPVASGPSGTIGTTTPTFSWTQLPAVQKYRLWVYNITDGQYEPTGFRQTLFYTTTQYTPPPLPSGKSYRWSVKAYNSQGPSTGTPWVTFDIP